MLETLTSWRARILSRVEEDAIPRFGRKLLREEQHGATKDRKDSTEMGLVDVEAGRFGCGWYERDARRRGCEECEREV